MIRTYKYRIYPTKNQEFKMNYTIDLCRQVYNSYLLDRTNAWKNSKKSISCFDQIKSLVNDKENVELLNEIHSQVLQDVLRKLDKSFKNFYRRCKKKSDTPGYPRLQAEGRYHSFTYPQSGYKIVDGKLKLSKIGHIKIKLSRPLEGKVKSCTITKESDRWYACFNIDIEPKILPETGKQIGIDVGINHFAVLSDGTFIDNPKYYRTSELKLKRAQRKLSKKKLGSANRRKAKKVVSNIHYKIRNQRADFLHKLSRNLVNQYDLIAVEDLKVKNMLKNHHLSKSISDASWSKFFGYLVYKAEEAGRAIVKVDPKGTSQNCSHCGTKVAKGLNVRIHDCPHCVLKMNRDHNAALNILKIGLGQPKSKPVEKSGVLASSTKQEANLV